MFGFFQKAAEIVAMPMAGKVIEAAEIPDGAYAQETMGPTLGIEPSDGRVYAPVDGTVELSPEYKHTLTVISTSGLEVFIHIGIDTIKLQGKPFTVHVEDGQQVKKGELLLTADLAAIRAAGMPTVTSVVLLEAEDYGRIEKSTAGSKVGETLFSVEK